jgi:hypothetical protein
MEVRRTHRAWSREPSRPREARRRGGRSSPTHNNVLVREDDGVVGEGSGVVLQDREVLGLRRDTKMETGTEPMR